jgi:hypothetical protein
MSILKALFALPEELKDLDHILDNLSEEALTDWESEFVESLQERLIKYQSGTPFTLTDRQWNHVDRLRDKYCI